MRKYPVILIVFFTSLIVLFGCQTKSQSGNAENISGKYINPATLSDNLQTVTTQFHARNFAPITVQVGVPVKWTIKMDEKDLNGCNNAMIIPNFDIEQDISVGETVISFTPMKTGSVPYSCWMGMIRDEIIVVDDLSTETIVSDRPSADHLN